jgi:hypothetical protein
VGFVLLLEEVLLETLPSASTPITVNEYVLLGVTPCKASVCGTVLVHAGSRKKDPAIIKRASSPQAFRDRFPPAAPKPAITNIGKGSHSA